MIVKKKRAYDAVERVLKEANEEWLPSQEIMVRANMYLPSRSSIMVGGVSHWVKVLEARNMVERKGNKTRVYRWIG